MKSLEIIFSKKWLAVIAVAVTLFITIPACSSSSTTTATTPAAPATGPAVTVNLTAQNLAFDQSTITVAAGSAVTINFSNKDSGIPHNFALYTDSSASKSIFVGNTATGVTTTTYTFSAPAKGTYYFRCDFHPTQMSGSFIVQ
jgi:plastocyanin